MPFCSTQHKAPLRLVVVPFDIHSQSLNEYQVTSMDSFYCQDCHHPISKTSPTFGSAIQSVIECDHRWEQFAEVTSCIWCLAIMKVPGCILCRHLTHECTCIGHFSSATTRINALLGALYNCRDTVSIINTMESLTSQDLIPFSVCEDERTTSEQCHFCIAHEDECDCRRFFHNQPSLSNALRSFILYNHFSQEEVRELKRQLKTIQTQRKRQGTGRDECDVLPLKRISCISINTI
jgi:hypothetical protein